jgi:DNA modification methylase
MEPYYEDASVRLYLGDCREVLQQLEAMSIDHTITDPPYARDVYLRASAVYTKVGSGTPKRMGLSEEKRRGGALQKMANGDIGHIDEMLDVVAGLIARVTKRWAIVFSDAETTYRWRSALQARGPLVRDTFAWEGMRYVRTGAWVKPDAMPQMSGDRPAVGFEPCTIVHAQGPMRWNGGGHAALWTHFISKGSDRPDHPCPKPEPLMRELIELFTDQGEVILDPFAGSGTTLLAAKRLGRRAIGIEVTEQYCEVAAKRLQQGALDLFAPAEEHTQQELDGYGHGV